MEGLMWFAAKMEDKSSYLEAASSGDKKKIRKLLEKGFDSVYNLVEMENLSKHNILWYKSKCLWLNTKASINMYIYKLNESLACQVMGNSLKVVKIIKWTSHKSPP